MKQYATVSKYELRTGTWGNNNSRIAQVCQDINILYVIHCILCVTFYALNHLYITYSMYSIPWTVYSSHRINLFCASYSIHLVTCMYCIIYVHPFICINSVLYLLVLYNYNFAIQIQILSGFEWQLVQHFKTDITILNLNLNTNILFKKFKSVNPPSKK